MFLHEVSYEQLTATSNFLAVAKTCLDFAKIGRTKLSTKNRSAFRESCVVLNYEFIFNYLQSYSSLIDCSWWIIREKILTRIISHFINLDIDECSTNFHSCKAGFEENCAAISVPEPIALYPLNSKYETREINNQQPQGTPVGVSLATGPDGKPGGSYQFAGHASSYIEFPNSGGLHVKHSITMLCWVYLETPYASGPLFNYGLIVFWGVHFRISYGKLVAHFKDSADEPLTTTQSLAAKQWYYVGSSYDHNTGNASLWLNGTRVVHKKIGADITLATGHEVRMGARANPDDPRYFMGRITAMQVYDVALTAEHINEVKDAGQGRNY
ncbi:uncharacterized protein LOC144632226 [Oculina patagonica]